MVCRVVCGGVARQCDRPPMRRVRVQAAQDRAAAEEAAGVWRCITQEEVRGLQRL